ncbi:MAG: zinc ABC transporter substrate-binding protein [Methanomassiliicoccales archaeon]
MSKKTYNISQKFLSILIIAVLIVAGALAFMLIAPPGNPSHKLQVVATFYPLYFFASEVAGDRAEVHMLIPDNVEPHSWEPSPSDIIKLSRADILIFNGVGFEPWMEDILASASNPNLELVDTSVGVSLLPSDEEKKAYDEALRLLETAPGLEISASKSTDEASLIESNSTVISVALLDFEGAKGGYLKIRANKDGDFRFFLTSTVNFTLSNCSGSPIEPEKESGPVSWYPQFASSAVFSFKKGELYTLKIGPTPLSEFEAVILKMEEHETEPEDHLHGINDPHFWLDPLSAKVQVLNILSAFQRADPDNSTYYADNAARLGERLDKLHMDFQLGLRNRTKNAIVTTHEGFNYLAMRYGFQAYGAIGISADQQPSPTDLMRLTALVRDLGLRYVFSEPVYSDAVMETISRETGASILILDGLHGRKGIHSSLDYFGIMYANLESLKIGLEVTL